MTGYCYHIRYYYYDYHFTVIIHVQVSQHPQLRTGGFCWSKVLLPACPF